MARELNNEFSWKTATFMARLSYHCYADEKEFKKQFGGENVYFAPIEVVLEQSERFEKKILDYVAKN